MIAVEEARRSVLETVERSAALEPDTAALLEAAVRLLHERFDAYGWVGVYLVEEDDLVLAAWHGPQATEHVRIPIGQGVCGAAAASGTTEIVDDVSADERYLACFASTRSEIVVPIHVGDRVVGEIDIDSDEPAAFDESDRTFLEALARTLATRLP